MSWLLVSRVLLLSGPGGCVRSCSGSVARFPARSLTSFCCFQACFLHQALCVGMFQGRISLESPRDGSLLGHGEGGLARPALRVPGVVRGSEDTLKTSSVTLWQSCSGRLSRRSSSCSVSWYCSFASAFPRDGSSLCQLRRLPCIAVALVVSARSDWRQLQDFGTLDPRHRRFGG